MAKNFNTNTFPQTYRMTILRYLALNGGEATKEQIIKAVWGKTREDFIVQHSNYTSNDMRGWASSTFSEMVKDKRLRYDRHTRKWYLGEKGWEIIAKCI